MYVELRVVLLKFVGRNGEWDVDSLRDDKDGAVREASKPRWVVRPERSPIGWARQTSRALNSPRDDTES